MTARRFGEAAARGTSELLAKRTWQPVRRNSYHVGERELHLWRPIDPTEINARIKAARLFDRQRKAPGQRNGALGHIAIEILEALYEAVDFTTGQLDPSIDWICSKIGRARAAVVRAMARLKLHGWLAWIRRTEPTGNKEGPQVRQITNAYVFGLPRDMVAWVAKKLKRRPKDAIEGKDRVAQARATWLKNKPSEPLPDGVLKALKRRASERDGASSPRGQNPASKRRKE